MNLPLSSAALGDAGWAPWAGGFMFSPTLTVGRATSQVLRNVTAERMQGLPHDTDEGTGKTWAKALAASRTLLSGVVITQLITDSP